MNSRSDGLLINIIILAMIVTLCVLYNRRRKIFATEFGSAFFAYDKLLSAWGMLAGRGLILGRTLSGYIIRIPEYTHVLLVGGTGSGKGVGVIIPNLLDYRRGSVIVFDTKGDLYSTTSARRKRLGRVIRLSPFGKEGDKWNPLDAIRNDTLLIDRAKALAESLVVRPTAGSLDEHWDNKAAQIIAAVLVFVLIRLPDVERNLNSLQDIVSDPLMLHTVGGKLKAMGGIYGRMGAAVHGLFDKDGYLTKEGAGVESTVLRHTDFLNSESVAASVAESTFSVRELLVPGTTLYLQIPPGQLEAQKNLLRCWVSTLIRELSELGSEEKNEIFFLLDECSALNGLAALEETLTRGRSSGIRMLLVYQSDDQVKTAFRDKSSLIYDNTATQVYLGASSIETAERLSKMLGTWTQPIESYGDNWGVSQSNAKEGGHSMSQGGSSNLAPQSRPLLFPDEILRLSNQLFIAFQSGFPAAVLGRRIRWFEDPAFNPAVPKPKKRWRFKWVDFRPERVPFVLCFLIIGFWILGSMPRREVVLPQYESFGPKQKRGEPWQKSVKDQ
jgi:type IV secretion system protein VirD4